MNTVMMRVQARKANAWWWVSILAQFVFVVSAACMPSSLYAATGTLAGVIRDSATTQPLPGAIVRLSNTTLGKVSTRTGSFVFRSIPTGQYQLTVSLLGYGRYSRTVVVRADDSTYVECSLIPQLIKTSEVVVSANKRLQAAQDVPISIAVVDGQTINDRNATKLDEVLRYVPGVNVAQSQVDIRGASGFAYGVGSRTTLMLDNFPLLSADNGDMSFDALPMFAVDRIEVVKGPGSALYGSSAIGGVVNVLTREPSSEESIRLRAYSGFYTKPHYDAWDWSPRMLRMEGVDASYTQSLGKLSFIVAAGVRGDDTHLQSNDSFRGSLYAKCNYALSPFSQLMIFRQYAYEDHANFVNWQSLEHATQPPVSTVPDIRIYSSKLAAGAELKNIIDENSFAVFRGSVYRTWYTNTAPVDSAAHMASTAMLMNTEGQFTTAINKKIALTAGVSFNANDVSSVSTNGSKVQFIAAGYGQTEFSNLDDIIVTLGGRIDIEKTRSENKNIELSPKLGISYKAPTATNVRMSVGRSFRAPSILERYADIRFAGFTVGHNPSLKPEKGWAFELGAEQTFEFLGLPWNLDAALFQSELYELIEPQFVVNATKSEIQFINVTRARIQGVELDVKTWLMKKVLGVESSITAMQPTDLSTDKTLMFRHNIMWTNRILVDWNAFELQMDYRFLSRQKEVDARLVNLGLVVNGDVRVPAHVVDARLIYDFAKSFNSAIKLTLNVRNMLDYYYVEVPGNLAPTRSISIQIDASL